MPVKASYEDLIPSSEPAAVEGRLYYDSTDKVLKYYDGSQWITLGVTGYTGFDNNGGGAWTKYINIPITTSPSEYTQYRIEIDSTYVTVYSADGTQKTQGDVASDFWANVQGDGDDIRAFDEAKSQLYFWVESFDYTNKQATIWGKVEAGISELNIAYGNPSALKSSYEDPEQVFEFFDDFEGASLDTTRWSLVDDSVITMTVENSILKFSGSSDTEYHEELVYHELTEITDFIAYTKMKTTEIGTKQANRVSYGDNVIRPDATDLIQNGLTKWASDYDTVMFFYKVVDGTSTIVYEDSNPADTNWHIYGLAKSGTTYKAYLDWEYKAETTATVDTNYLSLRAVVDTATTEIWFDWVFIAKLADPADFGTPQTLEF